EADNLIKAEDYEGNVTEYAYDALNRRTDIWEPAMEGTERGHTAMTYYDEADPETNLKTVTDQEGNMTQYEHNRRYLRTKRINACLDEYERKYDDNGNLEKEIDEEKNETDYEYDAFGRVTAVKKYLSKCEGCEGGPVISTKYKYDRNGNRTEVTDPRLKKTVTEYDSWNRPWKLTGPGYDENGSIIETFTEYDGGGNVVRTVDGRGTDRTWIRDKRGLVEKYTDGEGEETSYQYDLNGNTRFITDGRNTVT
ncbi:RHS repeat domain-containing protein, partial [Herbaspirillum sp.]|uniref:RHS repeat domain-containing protein n=1 Tax=Herbaspirillum sp. TaxID=1890675 RepID=UPI00258E0746